MPTDNQLDRIRKLTESLTRLAASFYSNERDVLRAAELEQAVPRGIERYQDLSLWEAEDLLHWLRQCETEAGQVKGTSLFGRQ